MEVFGRRSDFSKEKVEKKLLKVPRWDLDSLLRNFEPKSQRLHSSIVGITKPRLTSQCFTVPEMATAGAAAANHKSEYEATIARLEAENRQLREENLAASTELESLQRDRDSKLDEIQNLYEEILRAVEENAEALEEALRELRDEKNVRSSMADAHRNLERRIDFLHDESSSVILSALAVQADLEERLERKAMALRFLSEKVLRMLRWTRETVCGEEGAKGGPVDGEDVDDEGLRTMIEPFVDEVEKIRLGLLRRGIGCNQMMTLCWF
ncbi:hypothetical protein H6P81_020884 [Aristolochia fimbriata]|uniref:Uncharacterized protein n=1 Tax=Aristolochia fimbriata TaxID=158543 RepID=A0AAV7DW19_ARIFI|nr:hypothetical protein H6P81_020884 [Aristolochia fimbriata]